MQEASSRPDRAWLGPADRPALSPLQMAAVWVPACTEKDGVGRGKKWNSTWRTCVLFPRPMTVVTVHFKTSEDASTKSKQTNRLRTHTTLQTNNKQESQFCELFIHGTALETFCLRWDCHRRRWWCWKKQWAASVLLLRLWVLLQSDYMDEGWRHHRRWEASHTDMHWNPLFRTRRTIYAVKIWLT